MQARPVLIAPLERTNAHQEKYAKEIAAALIPAPQTAREGAAERMAAAEVAVTAQAVTAATRAVDALVIRPPQGAQERCADQTDSAEVAVAARAVTAATRAANAWLFKALAWADRALRTASAAQPIQTAEEVYALFDTARKSVWGECVRIA